MNRIDTIEANGSRLSSLRALALLSIALGVSAALVGLFLRGGWGLGLALAVLAVEAGLWLYLGGVRKRSGALLSPAHMDRSKRLLLVFLTAVVIFLGSTYYFYANMMLHVVNFPVILYLLIVQSLLMTGSSDRDWDEPLFWVESGLAALVRPFASLPRLGWMAGRAFGLKKDAAAAEGEPAVNPANRPGRLLGQILLGVLLAVPVLLIAGSLLASADAVFSRFFADFIQYWRNLSIKERLFDLALTLVLFPFIFSYLESCRSRWQLLPRRKDPAELPQSQPALSHRERSLNMSPVTLISFLSSVNLLYILFAIIQVAYLTGAFQFILPDGMTYAEYARNGFFELAGIAPINVLLILLAVKGAGRQGLAGRILRVQSLLLVAGSFVQWLSAIFRMQMYIRAYDLTLMRFFVSAFMILMAVVFVLLVIKEFRPSFAFFKAAAIAAVLSLVILNAVDADTRIARFNIDRAIADPSGSFDLEYFRELSPDTLLILQDALPKFDPERQVKIRALVRYAYIDLKLGNEGERWQSLNWREERNCSGMEGGCYLE